jgi:hypothetical protein
MNEERRKRAPVQGTGAAVSAAWWEELDAAELDENVVRIAWEILDLDQMKARMAQGRPSTPPGG